MAEIVISRKNVKTAKQFGFKFDRVEDDLSDKGKQIKDQTTYDALANKYNAGQTSAAENKKLLKLAKKLDIQSPIAEDYNDLFAKEDRTPEEDDRMAALEKLLK